jgi:hypothetical protein
MERSGVSEQSLENELVQLKKNHVIEIRDNKIILTPKGFLLTIQEDEPDKDELDDYELLIKLLQDNGPQNALGVAKLIKGPQGTKSMVNNLLYKGLRAGFLVKINEDTWDIMSVYKKPSERKINKCVVCDQESPDHTGRNCPMRLKPQVGGPREIFLVPGKDGDTYTADLNDAIRQLEFGPSVSDGALPRLVAVEDTPEKAVLSKDLSNQVYEKRLAELREKKKNGGSDSPSRSPPRSPFELEIDDQDNEGDIEISSPKQHYRIQRFDQPEPRSLESSNQLEILDPEMAFLMQWSRSRDTAQYLHSLYLFDFNGENARKYTMLGEKFAYMNLIKYCIDSNTPSKQIQPYVSERIGASILGASQPGKMKTDICKILNAVVIKDETVGRFLYSVLGALFYKKPEFYLTSDMHDRMMRGLTWF